jgi:hypothetical protein
MLTINCPGVPAQSSPATGSATWQPGTTSDLVQPGFEGNCGDLNANVSGRVATALPSQSCTEDSVDSTSGDDITQELSLKGYEFVVSADGKTATQIFNGTDLYTDVTTGDQLSCTFNETASLSK